jgi:hypothetical protein
LLIDTQAIMPEVYLDVRSLEGKPKEGNGECVSLVKNLTAVGWTGKWRQGDAVVANNSIQQGTAIATFVDGRYANQSHGNHATLASASSAGKGKTRMAD